MEAKRKNESPTNRTKVERPSERELVVTRIINAPPRLVFEAFTKPELLRQWWVPKSSGLSLLSCEADVRVGGTYRLVFDGGASEPMEFYGRYTEVTPPSRLAWTNEEGEDGGAVTTVTFEEKSGKTLLVMRDVYRSKEALEAAFVGMEGGMSETLDQLDEFVSALGVTR